MQNEKGFRYFLCVKFKISCEPQKIWSPMLLQWQRMSSICTLVLCHPFTWVFPSCICSTLSRSEMAACTFLTWKTSRWQSCTYLTNNLAKTEPQNVGQIWKLIQIASLHIHGQTTQVCQVSLGEIPWHIRWKIQQIFQVLCMQLASCFTFRKSLSSLAPSWIL